MFRNRKEFGFVRERHDSKMIWSVVIMIGYQSPNNSERDPRYSIGKLSIYSSIVHKETL